MRCPICGEVVTSRTCPHCGSPTQPTSQGSSDPLPSLTESEVAEMRSARKRKLKKAGKFLMSLTPIYFAAHILGSYFGYEMSGVTNISLGDLIKDDLPGWIIVAAIFAIVGFILYRIGNKTNRYSKKADPTADETNSEQAEATLPDPIKFSVTRVLFQNLTAGKIVLLVLFALAIAMLLCAILSSI